MSESLAAPYAAPEQQRDAAHLGMWVFLATEILFFGGLFLGYAVYRFLNPDVFARAGEHMAFWLGSANTALLLTSSFTMALAVHDSRGAGRRLPLLLALTAALGVVFLAVKGLEYAQHIHEGLLPGPRFHWEGGQPDRAQLFFLLYYAMTGLHAVHVSLGVATMLVLAVMARRRRFSAAYHTPVELAGLYWHFVDVVWIFLYPLFYLIPKP